MTADAKLMGSRINTTQNFSLLYHLSLLTKYGMCVPGRIILEMYFQLIMVARAKTQVIYLFILFPGTYDITATFVYKSTTKTTANAWGLPKRNMNFYRV